MAWTGKVPCAVLSAIRCDAMRCGDDGGRLDLVTAVAENRADCTESEGESFSKILSLQDALDIQGSAFILRILPWSAGRGPCAQDMQTTWTTREQC